MQAKAKIKKYLLPRILAEKERKLCAIHVLQILWGNSIIASSLLGPHNGREKIAESLILNTAGL